MSGLFLKAPSLQGRGWGGACPFENSPTNSHLAQPPHPSPSPKGEGL